MQNIKIKLDKKTHMMTVTIDMSKNLGASASGKTDIVAKTGGFMMLDPESGIKMNLTVTRPPKD